MKRLLVVTVLGLLTTGTFAQGGGRPATQAEKAFSTKVLAACAKAIPPGPTGWESREKPNTAAPESLAAAEGIPIPLFISAAWSDPKQAHQGAAGPSKNPKEDALLSKQAELADALAKASQKNDTAAADLIQKELDDIEVQLDAIEAARESAPKVAAPTAPPDASLRVRVDVNPPVIPLPAGAKSLPAVSGCTAYRLPDGGPADPRQPGSTLVLVGTWSEKKEGGAARVEASRRSGATATSVQCIAVRVEAVPSRAEKVVKQVDWASIKALLSK